MDKWRALMERWYVRYPVAIVGAIAVGVLIALAWLHRREVQYGNLAQWAGAILTGGAFWFGFYRLGFERRSDEDRKKAETNAKIAELRHEAEKVTLRLRLRGADDDGTLCNVQIGNDSKYRVDVVLASGRFAGNGRDTTLSFGNDRLVLPGKPHDFVERLQRLPRFGGTYTIVHQVLWFTMADQDWVSFDGKVSTLGFEGPLPLVPTEKHD